VSTQPADLEPLAGAQAATIEELGNVSIAEVLAALDKPAPDPRALYYRWERQQWEAGPIDLSADAAQWPHLQAGTRATLLTALSTLGAGDDRIAEVLVPFVDAVPSEEQQVFLTSQLADRARAAVFFDRFRSEVVEAEVAEDKVTARNVDLAELVDLVAARAEVIRHERDAGVALYEGLFLFNVLFGGVIAPVVHRKADDMLVKVDRLPALRRGLLAIARDSTRHALFGVRLLQELNAPADRATNDGLGESIEALIGSAIPLVRRIVGEGDPATTKDGGPSAAAMELLARRMQDIGIDLPG
jgi:ribonucleoside-diphosphate reductase beta chain